MITIIAALSENNIIGKDGKIPWYIPADLKRFKELTIGHIVIMGRKTFESIPTRFRPLPNRDNIVLTSQPNYGNENNVYNLTGDLIEIFLSNLKKDAELFIIGGQSLYELGISFADKLELTFIEKEYDGDTFFPTYEIDDKILSFNSGDRFMLTEHEQHDGYSFQTYYRNGDEI